MPMTTTTTPRRPMREEPTPSAARRPPTTTGTDATTPAPRLTLSQIVTMLLAKPGRDHSSVELTRNAKGETQITVTVRAGESDGIDNAADAAAECSRIYEQLRRTFPLANGKVGDDAAADKP